MSKPAGEAEETDARQGPGALPKTGPGLPFNAKTKPKKEAQPKAQHLSFTLRPTIFTTLGNQELNTEEVHEQFGFLAQTVGQIATKLTQQHFNPEDLTLLYQKGLEKAAPARKATPTSPAIPAIPGFPSKGHVAPAKLGWFPSVAQCQKTFGVYLPDRGMRMACEWMIRVLRSTARRYIITQVLIDVLRNNNQGVWQPDTEGVFFLTKVKTVVRQDCIKSAVDKLKKTHKVDVERPELENRLRAIRNFVLQYEQLPESLCNMETPPVCTDLLLAPAADKQWQKMTQVGRELIWQFKLPRVKQPKTRGDYKKILVKIQLPAYLPPDTEVNTPNVRLGRQKSANTCLLLDMSYTIQTLPPLGANKRRYEKAMSIDWGSTRSLLTLLIGHKGKGGKLVIDSQPLFFNITIIAEQLKDLKKQQDSKQRQITCWKHLQSKCLDAKELVRLEGFIQKAEIERKLLNNKRQNLNQHLAHVAALWVIRTALAAGVKTIYIENLKSLAFDAWTPWAEVVTDAVRGKIFGYLQDWCDRTGIKLETVNPYRTSLTCSHCITGTMEFYTHSTCTTKGHLWAKCDSCGYTVHRDYNAAVNILSAGVFKTSPKRFRNPTAYSKTFKTVGFKRKKKPSKTKNTPTPKQKKSANKKSNPEPRKTAVNKEQHRSTPNPNVGSTSGARSSKHSSKIVTRSSISYHHPRKWRLRGHFSSSRVEQEVQVAAGGLYPLVVPCQIQPLASPQAV